MTPHHDRHSKTNPEPERLSPVLARNRIPWDERNEPGIGHAYMFRKDDFVGKDN